MAITYSYPLGTPKLTDTVLGVQYEEMKDPAVKNFSISDIATLAIEEIGNISQGPVGPQGPTGAQGVQGNPGTPGAVGPAGVEWRGSWNKNTSYVADDAVAFSGSSYFCILAISGSLLNENPINDTTHWALLASQGAQGIQGVQGPTGSQGPAGTISYTEESRNTTSLSNVQNPAILFSKITKTFTRAFVSSAINNFLGLSNIGKVTGDFFVVQNKSTTLDLVVVPLDDARFLQPNGFASQINFTVKANTYARFTLTETTSGSDKVFMVEVIKPLGAAPTLQQVTNEGANSYGNTINLKNTSISDSTIQFNVGDFFEPFIKVENLGAGSLGHFTKLGSSTIEFDGNGDYNTILEAGAGLNNTVTLPSESGTLALVNYKVYTALLTQAGTNAPVAIVLENTLGGTIVWSRFNTGTYRGTLTGAFTVNKTIIFNNITNGNIQIASGTSDVNTVQLIARDMSGNAQDGGVNSMSLEIRVYN